MTRIQCVGQVGGRVFVGFLVEGEGGVGAEVTLLLPREAARYAVRLLKGGFRGEVGPLTVGWSWLRVEIPLTSSQLHELSKTLEEWIPPEGGLESCALSL